MTPLSEHRARLEQALDERAAPLDRLVAGRLLRDHLDRLERDNVRAARARGASYGEIARAIGRSRQAVHERFRGLPAVEPESAADRWWRERRELEAWIEQLNANRITGQAPIA